MGSSLQLIQFSLFFTLPVLLFTQDCATYQAWGERLEVEFPAVNFGQLVYASRQSEVYLNLLFAEENFTPTVGAAFTTFNERSRQKAARRWLKCRQKQHPLKAGTTTWLSQFAIAPFVESRLADRVIGAAENLRELRASASKELERLRTTESVVLADLLGVERSLPVRYAGLWPSEIANLRQKLQNLIVSAAQVELDRALELAQQQPPSLSHLRYLGEFADHHEQALSRLSPEPQRLIAERVIVQIKATLTHLLPSYEEQLDGIDTQEIMNLTLLTKLKQRVRKDFNGFVDYELIQQHLHRINRLQTSIVVANDEQLAAIFRASQKENDLVGIAQLLDQLDQRKPAVVRLRQTVTERLNELAAVRAATAERKRKQDELLARRDAETARKWEAYAAVTNRRIDQLRKQLEVKYGGALPTFEQLFHLQRYAAHIQSKTEVSDERNFRRYASKIGLQLVNRDGKLYSNNNRFVSGSGFSVVTSRLETSSSLRAHLFTTLTVQGVPKDVLELYHLELTTRYRHRNATRKARKDLPEAGKDYESDEYVNSGGTIYSLAITNGKLQLKVSDNTVYRRGVRCADAGGGWMEVAPYAGISGVVLAVGDEFTVSTAGNMKVGVLAGMSTPSGIKGFDLYSVDRRWPHAALLGRVGKGEWFLIGAGNTFRASTAGMLQFKINDLDLNNNEGVYLVRVDPN
jgi:hypothetical protein